MIGNPILDDKLKEFIKSKGGVYRVIPWDLNISENENQIFSVFGANYIVPTKQSSQPYSVPVLGPCSNSIIGLSFEYLNSENNRLEFSFKWNGRLYTNKSSADRDIYNILHSTKGILPTADSNCISAYELNKSMKMQNASFVLISHDKLGCIIVFDDLEVESDNYDHISSRQRIQIVLNLKKLGFVQVSADTFELVHSKQKLYTIFPDNTRTLDRLDDNSLNANSLKIVTPTRGAYQIIKSKELSAEEKTADLKNLVSLMPVNLEQLKMINPPLDFGRLAWANLLKELNMIQKKTVQNYMKNRVWGVLGQSTLKGPLELTKKNKVESYQSHYHI